MSPRARAGKGAGTMRDNPTLRPGQIDRIRSAAQLRPVEADEAVTRDYLVNLLSLNELVARVSVALKQNYVSDEERVLFSVGDLHLDASRYLVQKRGRPLHLTP